MARANQVGVGEIRVSREIARAEQKAIGKGIEPIAAVVMCARGFDNKEACEENPAGKPYLKQGRKCELCGKIGRP